MLRVWKNIREFFGWNLKPEGIERLIFRYEFNGVVSFTEDKNLGKKYVTIESSPKELKYRKLVFLHDNFFSRFNEEENVGVTFRKTYQFFNNIDNPSRGLIKVEKQYGMIWSKDNHKKCMTLKDVLLISQNNKKAIKKEK